MLKRVLLNTYQYYLRFFEYQKLLKVKFDNTVDGVKVFTGFQDKNNGGGLKLKDLKKFESTDLRYNILYLVSSALPFSYMEMIKKAKRAGIKIVWNQNGIGFPAWAGKESNRINRLMKKGLINADFIIFQSKFAEESVNNRITSTETIKSKIVYNCINTSLFNKKEYTSSKPRILVAGSHNNIERVTTAIEIFEILHKKGIECELIIAGLIKKRFESIIKKIISEKSLSNFIQITGQYGRYDGATIFSACDILLHLQPFDNCPTVVVEAMASGLVIVGPNNGGIPELVGSSLSKCLVTNKTTYDTYDWGSPKEYANKIVEVLPDLPNLQRMSRIRAENNFDLSMWVSSHEEIFNELKMSFIN
ncbi:MAG: glycosyltransferase family 4 protein [Bacteroidota bacterium]